jgi:hypothetical protein
LTRKNILGNMSVRCNGKEKINLSFHAILIYFSPLSLLSSSLLCIWYLGMLIKLNKTHMLAHGTFMKFKEKLISNILEWVNSS